MKIIAAPNAFKGSMTATAAAEAMRDGILAACPDCKVECVPVADGGDGFTDVMCQALAGTVQEVTVAGPRMAPVAATFCYIRESHTAIIEMAKASGLALLPEAERDPTETSTYGTGQLILAALRLGARKIVIGLGGSATCDGGIGMATALGYRFLDSKGHELPPTGKSLQQVRTIDPSGFDGRLLQTECIGVCDVSNPLYGANGASFVYSPQKGAGLEQVRMLDEGLRNLASVMMKDLGTDVRSLAGGGAAGGLGAGLHGFLGTRLEKGIDVVMDLVGLRRKLEAADLVLTGEGQIDYQTGFDKAPAGVARLARETGVPCLAICGSVGERFHALHDIGINGVFSLCPGPMPRASAMKHASALLTAATEQAVRAFLAGRDICSRQAPDGSRTRQSQHRR